MTPPLNEARFALITGASQGLGFAVACTLNRRGYTVILNARDKKKLAAAQKKLPFPQQSIFFAHDVSQVDFPHAFQKFIEKEKIPSLSVVVHAAGVNHIGTLEEIQLKNAEDTLRVNTLSVVLVAQAVKPALLKARNPQFVFVSSLMQGIPMPRRSVYAASKAAAELFVEAWRLELKREKRTIRVKIFRPAAIDTDFHENTKTDGDAPRSNVSRMSAEASAVYLLKLIESNRRIMAPGGMNKLVAFISRHLPRTLQFFISRG